MEVTTRGRSREHRRDARSRCSTDATEAETLPNYGLQGKRRKGLDVASVEVALRSYEASDIQSLETDICALVALAERYKLSAYDVAYLWLAAELKAPLATFDRSLGEAARTHLATPA